MHRTYPRGYPIRQIDLNSIKIKGNKLIVYYFVWKLHSVIIGKDYLLFLVYLICHNLECYLNINKSIHGKIYNCTSLMNFVENKRQIIIEVSNFPWYIIIAGFCLKIKANTNGLDKQLYTSIVIVNRKKRLLATR